MTRALTLLHTSEAHRATFDALRDRIEPDLRLRHIVRPDWLERARCGGDDGLCDEMAMMLRETDAALCTCTTLGPMAAGVGALRVDQPMMAEAAHIGGPVLLVVCLQSTYAPSLALLEGELRLAGQPERVEVLPLCDLWRLFETGQPRRFAQAIALAVKRAVTARGGLRSVVLAQASMAGAAPLLRHLDIPVLTSPESALRAAFARL